jgi:DNA-binding response OmpR family regulator
MLLSGITVLLIDEDPECLEVLSAHLRRHGAEVEIAGSASAGAWAARRRAPDVLICELDLTDLEGRSLLLALRSLPGCDAVPAIALTVHSGLIGRAQALGAGFEKYLVKPARLSDVATAICCLVQGSEPTSGTVAPMAELGDAITRRDFRSLMANLNGSTGHRQSAYFQLDGDRLASIWSFDRERPSADLFPWGTKIAETPCHNVVETGHPFVVEDSQADQRLTREQRRFAPMRSFCGVALHDERGVVVGVLCHFDCRPRAVDGRALELLSRTARLFRLVAVAV